MDLYERIMRLNVLFISIAVFIFGMLIHNLQTDVKELQEKIIILEQSQKGN